MTHCEKLALCKRRVTGHIVTNCDKGGVTGHIVTNWHCAREVRQDT